MIQANFYRSNGHYTAFAVRGHAGFGEAGSDIVCASVSSAVMLTVNGITECAGIPTAVDAVENDLVCNLQKLESAGDLFIDALVLHLTCLQEEYGAYLAVDVQDVPGE